MADDFYKSFTDSVSAPATRAIAVAKSDTVELPFVPKALYIGTGGDVVVGFATGDDVTFVGVPNGAVLPVRARYVRATGTDADDIVALS